MKRKKSQNTANTFRALSTVVGSGNVHLVNMVLHIHTPDLRLFYKMKRPSTSYTESLYSREHHCLSTHASKLVSN